MWREKNVTSPTATSVRDHIKCTILSTQIQISITHTPTHTQTHTVYEGTHSDTLRLSGFITLSVFLDGCALTGDADVRACSRVCACVHACAL